jgi:actin-like ATPase involved in cell morphogenesis
MSTVLVIDFGTTNTVAMVAVDGGEPRPVIVDGAPWFPSAVFAGAAGAPLVVGADAVVLGRPARSATRFERRLKARLDDGELRLGDTATPVTGAVRAVLERVVLAVGRPVDELVLTHPADWDQTRVGVLLAAAAGLAQRVDTLPEPVAVAAGTGIAVGETLLVVDFGGGTCDVAAVRRDETGPSVVASGSLPKLGGDDLDQRIVAHLVATAGCEPATGRGERLALLAAARTGKELLSRHRQVELALPDHTAVGLTRTEFDAVIAGDVESIVRLVRDVSRQAGEIADLLLVGGSSRVPLLATRLAEATGRTPRLDPEPETAVARGAMALLASRPVVEEGPPTAPTALPEPAVPERRRVPVAALAVLAVVVLLIAGAAVVVIGQAPETMSGQARAMADDDAPADEAGSAPEEQRLPAPLAGDEVADDTEREWTSGTVGTPIQYRVPGGPVLRIEVAAPEVFTEVPTYGAAPAGYRWVGVRTVLTNVSGPTWEAGAWSLTGLVDDRGQLLRPLDAAQPRCPAAEEPRPIEPGDQASGCGVLLVPAATPVTAVYFGDVSAGAEQPPIQFPVDLPAAGDEPATAEEAGHTGGPAVDATVGGVPLRAEFDLVTTPSAYTGAARPVPGSRFVVARGLLTATGLSQAPLYLRDDRGTLIAATPGVAMPECPAFTPPSDSTPVLACFLFEIDVDARPAGLTFGWPLAEQTTADVERWPTWVVR